MQSISHNLIDKRALTIIGLNLFALLLIYFIPTLSHLTSLPLYFIEPMRLMLILSMVHVNRKNAYFLALTLPLFSFFISSHPVFLKVILISGELLLNAWLFYFILNKSKKLFPSIFGSIILSKITYYVFKFAFIKFAFLNSSLISTPILIQIITTILFSFYLYKFFRKSDNKVAG